MLPVMQKSVAVMGDQASPEREPSHQSEEPESLSQWNISKFPPGVISHTLACMDCDTIAQVHDTCLVFREAEVIRKLLRTPIFQLRNIWVSKFSFPSGLDSW